MTNLFKKFSLFLVGTFVVCALFGCVQQGGGGVTPTPGPVQPGPSGQEVDPAYISLTDYKAYILADLDAVVEGLASQVTSAQKASIDVKAKAGKDKINAALNIQDVRKAFDEAKEQIANVIPKADGFFNYSVESNATKTEILGLVEAYAVRNGITGISLFENGGYQMYNPRVVLGTENYIVGYGFGTLAEGSLTGPLASESNDAWKMYYHSVSSSDPGTANYLNDKGSVAGDFYGYIGASYVTTFMNATKDGYDWVPELAKSKPVAVNDDGSGLATKWKYEVKVGEEVKYNTNSQDPARKAFDGRPVELEDYITPFKLLLNQSNGYYRGSELANSKSGAIKGAKDWFNKTKEGLEDAPSFEETVGIKAYEEDGKAYLEFEFTSPLNAFFAMYYTTSSLYMPIPQSFLDLVTVQNYLGFNADKSFTPVDNSLSLGAYTLEKWDSGQQVVYKKNPYYVHGEEKYAIEGVHINILTAATTDPEAAFNEFQVGKTDSCGIPQTKLDEFKNDPRTRQTKGDSVFKLNVNATDAATWETLFGENGKVMQTSKEDYWALKPALGNAHFVKALSLSIDRVKFADARGCIGSVDYLAPNYMSDPENGISYSTTPEHAEAVAGLKEGTDGYGFSMELARDYFRVALSELEADGAYTPGTPENPTVIELEIAWQVPAHETLYHNEVKGFLEDAFNDESVCGGAYKLEVKFWVGASWDSVYYDKMMTGQFDIGFGSISGNTLNPLDYMTVLSADQEMSGGFTLNWGSDTNDVDADILVYKGYRYSFDALVSAGNTNTIVSKGQLKKTFEYKLEKLEAQADGSYTGQIVVTLALPALTEFSVDAVVICWYEGDPYKEEVLAASAYSVSQAGDKVTIDFTVSKDLVDAYPGEMGIDIYYTCVFNGESAANLFSVYGEFPRP